MKKVFIIIACACMISACGSGVKTEATNDTIVSPELKEIQKSADDVNAKADELNQKADSLLNNI
jgi:peptidoglycan hydrolase CwlO-like protein